MLRRVNNHGSEMPNVFLAMPWNEVWDDTRTVLSTEELAAECMGISKWDPVCQMSEPFIHNVVSTLKVCSKYQPRFL